MTVDTIIDTNLLVYMYDVEAPPWKREKALDVVTSLIHSGHGVLPVQVLSEFFVAVTQKIATPLQSGEALARVDNYLQCIRVLPTTAQILGEAVRGVHEHQLSYWDAQIWASARLNQIPLIVTEDMPSKEYLEGVRYVNPFAARD